MINCTYKFNNTLRIHIRSSYLQLQLTQYYDQYKKILIQESNRFVSFCHNFIFTHFAGRLSQIIKPIINSYNQQLIQTENNTNFMDSPHSEQITHSRHTNTISQDDELDRCQQISDIKAKIKELQKCQASTRQRRQKLLQTREERLRASRDVSLSISNNASAIFSTNKSHKFVDEQISKYENIANITQEQNNNLKQQNDYLLSKLKKMKQKQKKYIAIAEKAQKYKELYQEALDELEVLKQQCKVYKDKAEEMKKIALLDVGKLEDKIMPFVRTLDETDSANSQAFSRGRSRELRQEIESKYAKQS